MEATAALIDKLLQSTPDENQYIIDAGDGKGYLSSRMALQYGHRVLGIDANAMNTENALSRNRKLQVSVCFLVLQNKYSFISLLSILNVILLRHLVLSDWRQLLLLLSLIPHFTFLIVILHAFYVQHIVTPNEHFAKIASHRSLDNLLRVGQLHVHVPVHRHQEAFVFLSPFEFHKYRLAGETI